MPSEHSSDLKFDIGHVLFIDIVGYSKLLITEQSEQLKALNAIVRGTEQFKKAEAEGKLLRLPTGDGGALVFRTTPEAPVLCAIEIAEGLKSYPELKVRMGVHSGPVNEITDLNEQANIAGAGINIAQRVMDCGDAGHILLSKHVSDDLEHYPHWRGHLRSLGEVEVKHGARIGLVNFLNGEIGNAAVPQKVRAQTRKRIRTGVVAAALILAVASGYFILQKQRARSISSIPDKSIAVLPFESLSDDKANAFVAEGIQDEILTRLAKIADLKVISRTSTQQFKSAPENLPDIARQLGVAHILEGTVQKSDNTLRVNVQLIRAANDSHLWAETFDRKLTDIFSIQSDIARAIAARLAAKLTGREEQLLAARPTENAEAYEAYLRGLAYTLQSQNTPANYLGAQKHLREAVQLDPKFAVAWALLSYVDARGYQTLNLQPTPVLREQAGQAAEVALTLQPDLGEALLAKGSYYYFCAKDYDAAVRYFTKARELLPNNSRIPELLAYVARKRMQWEASEPYFNEAERLDPRNVSLFIQHAMTYILQRRFAEANAKFDQVLEIRPHDEDTLVTKAAVAQAQGDLMGAAALLSPLHPAAEDPTAWETKAYQVILERSPAQIIPDFEALTTHPNPELGYLNGEVRFWLGWLQSLAGDTKTAQATWRAARSELEKYLDQQPTNFSLLDDLALVASALGDKVASRGFVERAMAANSIEKDPANGLQSLEVLARVAVETGDYERAIAVLEQILSRPGSGALATGVPLTYALLQLDPMFDPLRQDPRFQKLVEQSPSQDSN
jgi:TolB-like protein/cytochrome c-type biogenesis protein CcmH/NrfG